MAYDPNFPPDHQALVAAPFRIQFNGLADLVSGLQSQVAALQSQLAPLVPVLNRSAAGQWTLAYTGPAQATWLVWARYPGSEAWANTGEMATTDFPATDDAFSPGTAWWQIKMCGEGDNGSQTTPFSNVISVGPVPAMPARTPDGDG